MQLDCVQAGRLYARELGRLLAHLDAKEVGHSVAEDRLPYGAGSYDPELLAWCTEERERGEDGGFEDPENGEGCEARG